MVLLSARERAGADAMLADVAYIELSDRPDFNDRFIDQLAFPQMKSFSSRFVVPEFRRGAELREHPREELEALFRSLTHVHTIPGDPEIRKTLAGIRPGQVIRFKATLVLAVAPSGGRYESSLALGDRNCEIAWFDELELE